MRRKIIFKQPAMLKPVLTPPILKMINLRNRIFIEVIVNLDKEKKAAVYHQSLMTMKMKVIYPIFIIILP